MTVKRRYLVPEVVQTSGMDCGPASLKCLLDGFGIQVSYGRLREACQTDVDGTSIDTMEVVARQLGLQAEQIMVPIDHLLEESALTLPAIVVVQLPNGFTHFLVVWRRHGEFLQVMDPATGRRIMRCKSFMQEVFRHTMAVPADGWREWANDAENLDTLLARMAGLGIGATQQKNILEEAKADTTWLGLGTLDAAIRMTRSLLDSGAFRKGKEAERLLLKLFAARTNQDTLLETIPKNYWSVTPHPEDSSFLMYTGAVLVRVRGAQPRDLSAAESIEDLSPELVAALTEKPPSPLSLLMNMLREDGWLAPSVMIWAIIISGAAAILEALMLRSILDLGASLGLGWQRVAGAGLLMAFFALITALHFPSFRIIMGMGRHLEVRLRQKFLEKIPHIGDRYFDSRPRSDMADRSHRLMDIRKLPLLVARLILGVSETLVVTIAVIWLHPSAAIWALLLTAVSLGMPLLAHPILQETDMRVRTHLGALGKFYLDGLLGLIPLRSHVAEPAMRHQHERLVVEWVRTKLSFIRISAFFQGLRLTLTTGLTIYLVWSFLDGGGDPVHGLLFIYWVLRLPMLGQFTSGLIRQYPGQRNLTLRLMEPLGTPDETSVRLDEQVAYKRVDGHTGIHVRLEQVDVLASGSQILGNVNLDVKPGEHVAVVGPSGAGKSSLVGLLLGWYTASNGRLTVDGEDLDGDTLESLRKRTSWVDPAVQIWNRTFLENLHYGHDNESGISETLRRADLMSLLEKMPDGLQTRLGESGSLVSGGEGQRVRLGRAMLRKDADLVVLDEPFRGLDRQTRHLLLQRSRELWQGATLFCVTHDISETEDFERVLVIEDGKLAEDGNPQALIGNPESVYARLLQAERETMEEVWNNPRWRKLFLDRGHLQEEGVSGG